MSRTDHHAPLWTHAAVWEARHHRCPNDTTWGPDGRACTIPDRPVVEHRSSSRPAGRRCHWYPVDDRPGQRWIRRHGMPSPPRWYVRHIYHARQRTLARRDRQRTLAEYRATGDVWHEPQPEQARHSAQWKWW